jgi:hypothetical protein
MLETCENQMSCSMIICFLVVEAKNQVLALSLLLK